MSSCTRDYSKDLEPTIVLSTIQEDAPNFVTYSTQEIIQSTSSAPTYQNRTLSTPVTPPEEKNITFSLTATYETRINTRDYTYTTEYNTIIFTGYDSSLLEKNITIPLIEQNN